MNKIYLYYNNTAKTKRVKSDIIKILKKNNFILTKKDPDVILVIGGDGTMLNAIRHLQQKAGPFVGVNTGSLGFLPGVLPHEIDKLPEMLKSDHFITDELPLLEVVATTTAGKTLSGVAFNEINIRHFTPRLLEALLYFNGKPFNYFTGDGFIISTPVGATGYAIWAGAAAMHPSLKVYQVTPVHPNDNRINRPLKHSFVVPDDTKLTIEVIKPQRRTTMVSCDGEMFPENYLKTIEITRSQRKVKILKAKQDDYFDLFRNKIIDKNIFRFLEEHDEK